MKELDLIYATARELPPEERAAYLTRVCEGDQALRARVEQMLAVANEAEAFITDLPEGDLEERKPGRETVEDPKLASADFPEQVIGQKIGRYKILERLGEGGCGVVYVAEQTEPVRRRVALKVIKLGMDTKQVVARFEAERQALAMMDHPNIAKVLDAGTTGSGRPYFIMELVRGIKITDYCDQASLPTRERLDLFIKVCRAIQHAHQKGIIHRDIKPSNILVTLNDGVPVPKVIDFGIAKATEGRLTEATVYTQLHQFVGTPAYMSPEQAEMSSLDIDTRSDIYSLGVLLYELLTGKTPFDTQELMCKGIDAMRRTIREIEPAKPSTRLATLQGDELTAAAKRRAVEAPKLIHQLKGDLDWIVMKCLEKDRTRRYETANGVAGDIKRHLNNEPVLARPPSTLYEFQKTVRRHKFGFAAAATIVMVMAVGVTLATWQAARATRAEALALRSRSDAEKLSNFMLDDFYEELEPSGQFETVARLAGRAVAYYDGLPASLRTAETEQDGALARARLAMITARQGDVKAAMPLAKETAAKLEQMRQQGDQSDGTLFALGVALHAQYWCYRNRDEVQSEAAPLQQGAGILRPRATSPECSRRVKLEYARLLNLLSITQPPEQGVDTCEEALRILAGLGAMDLSDLTAASFWADTADSQAREALAIGRLDDAEGREKQALALAERVVARRPRDLKARMDLTYAPYTLTLIEASRFHEAAALQFATQCMRATELYLQINPSDVEALTMLARSDYSIAALLFRQGRVAEALQQARRAAQTGGERGSTGDFAPLTAWNGGAIARWEAQRENRSAAELALQEANRSGDALASRNRMAESVTNSHVELLDDADRQVRLAFGEDASVYGMASQALPRLDALRQSMSDPKRRGVLLHVQRQALDEAARAALNLGRPGDAETAARTLISLPSELGNDAEHLSLDQPDDGVWGQVLLAQAACEQGRKAEALQSLEPALAQYHDAQAHGAGSLAFCQHFARALYVQALAEPADSSGAARQSKALNEATALLRGLTDEARQLHDSKRLLSWIAAEQMKLNPNAEQTK